MPAAAHRFGELLRHARERGNQTAEVMAILLSMEPEDYLAIEAGLRFPDDNTVRRLCMMMEWNYNEVRRVLRNEMSSPGRLTAPPAPHLAGIGAANARPDTLAGRLKEVRDVTGQSTDIIAALLHVTPDQYQRLEEGETPGDDLLRRISVVYNWNFQELVNVLRSEQARNLQPRLLGNPFPGAAPRLDKLRAVSREMESLFSFLPETDQTFVLAQLDLIRATMARNRQRPPTLGVSGAPMEGSTPVGAADPRPTGKARRQPATPPMVSPEDRKLFS